ncbi:hypothetical protein BDK51DRAFT_32152, partial [Blyttiomyces helicus]
MTLRLAAMEARAGDLTKNIASIQHALRNPEIERVRNLEGQQHLQSPSPYYQRFYLDLIEPFKSSGGSGPGKGGILGSVEGGGQGKAVIMCGKVRESIGADGVHYDRSPAFIRVEKQPLRPSPLDCTTDLREKVNSQTRVCPLPLATLASPDFRQELKPVVDRCFRQRLFSLQGDPCSSAIGEPPARLTYATGGRSRCGTPSARRTHPDEKHQNCLGCPASKPEEETPQMEYADGGSVADSPHDASQNFSRRRKRDDPQPLDIWLEALQSMDVETEISDPKFSIISITLAVSQPRSSLLIDPQRNFMGIEPNRKQLDNKWQLLRMEMDTYADQRKQSGDKAVIKEPLYWDKYKAAIRAANECALPTILTADPQNATTPPIPPTANASASDSTQLKARDAHRNLTPKSTSNIHTVPESSKKKLTQSLRSFAPNGLSQRSSNGGDRLEVSLHHISHPSPIPHYENAHLLLERERRAARMKMQIETQERQIEAQKTQIDVQQAQIDAHKTRIFSLEESLDLGLQDIHQSLEGQGDLSHMKMRRADLNWRLAAMEAQAEDLTKNLDSMQRAFQDPAFERAWPHCRGTATSAAVPIAISS